MMQLSQLKLHAMMQLSQLKLYAPIIQQTFQYLMQILNLLSIGTF